MSATQLTIVESDVPWDTIISYSRTTFSCLSDCRSLTSRIAVTGKPSFSPSILICLSATVLPVVVWLALKTLPNVPVPTWPCTTYSFSLGGSGAIAGRACCERISRPSCRGGV